MNNNVPYNIFSKWNKDTRRKIVAVQFDDRPSALCSEESVQSVPAASDESKPVAEPSTAECEMSDKLVPDLAGAAYKQWIVCIKEKV